MVQKLVNDFRGRFTLGLYHTPNLRGIAKAIGPERFNEVMGLQHMKIYLFDDNVLLSGYVKDIICSCGELVQQFL